MTEEDNNSNGALYRSMESNHNLLIKNDSKKEEERLKLKEKEANYFEQSNIRRGSNEKKLY